MLWVLGNGIFHIFANFWVIKLEKFFEKSTQTAQNCLSPWLVIRSFLEDNF